MPPIIYPQNLIEVDRDKFTLTYSHRKWNENEFTPIKTYGVAVGMEGLATRRGYYTVLHRSKCPQWMVPDSEWAIAAGLVPGTVYDCDKTPDYSGVNPIKARWIGISEKVGIGIHGTSADDSIGTRASHGCVRMHIPDVIELYDLAPKYTIVHIQ